MRRRLAAMTLESSAESTRVVVSDADPRLRAAMADSLSAVGYDVVQVEHLGAPFAPDLHADFAVVRCLAAEMGGLTGIDCASDSASPKLAIGLLRKEEAQATEVGAVAEPQRDEHVIRIFAAIAPLFIDTDRVRAERLARGMHALRWAIWGTPGAAAANGESAASASDGSIDHFPLGFAAGGCFPRSAPR